MSTRAQVRFATREAGISFNEHPEKINAQFYVHSDGYPEGLGLDIANSLASCRHIGGWEIEELDIKHGDLEYIYYIWQDPSLEKKDTWISIFEVGINDHYCGECGHYLQPQLDRDKCIFVGTPEKLIEKYKLNTNEDG